MKYSPAQTKAHLRSCV